MLRTVGVFLWVCILLSLAPSSVTAQRVAESGCQAAREALDRVHELKPGDSRASLEEAFELDGGLQSATDSVYVLRRCNFIKIKVEFSPAQDAQQKEPLPGDKIRKISRPYLEYPFTD